MTRSLDFLRKQEWEVDITEYTVPRANRKRDLFGIADIMALKGKEILFVQTTTASNVSARVKKIMASEHLGAVRKAGIGVHIHGWKRGKNGRWQVREVDLS